MKNRYTKQSNYNNTRNTVEAQFIMIVSQKKTKEKVN